MFNDETQLVLTKRISYKSLTERIEGKILLKWLQTDRKDLSESTFYFRRCSEGAIITTVNTCIQLPLFFEPLIEGKKSMHNHWSMECQAAFTKRDEEPTIISPLKRHCCVSFPPRKREREDWFISICTPFGVEQKPAFIRPSFISLVMSQDCG